MPDGKRRSQFLLLYFRVLVHSASRFLAEPTRLDVLHHQRRRTEFLAQGFVQVFEDVQARIEADEVDHFERPHGMVQAEL